MFSDRYTPKMILDVQSTEFLYTGLESSNVETYVGIYWNYIISKFLFYLKISLHILMPVLYGYLTEQVAIKGVF